MVINTAPQLDFADTAESFIQCISEDTNGQINLSSKGNSCNFVNSDAFNHYLKPKPTPQSDAQNHRLCIFEVLNC